MIRSSFFLFLGRISNAGFLFLLNLIVSRKLGPADFGLYAFFTTVLQTSVHIAGFGLNTLMVRSVSHDPSRGKKYLSNILGLKNVTSLIVITAGTAIFSFFPMSRGTLAVLFVYYFSLLFLSASQTLWFYCNPFDRFDRHSLLWAVNNALKSVFGIVAVLAYGDLVILMLALLAAEMAGFVISRGVVAKTFGGDFRPICDGVFWKQLLREAAPLALNQILITLYMQSHILILKMLSEDETVGWYTVAYRMFELFVMTSNVISTTAFPVFTRDFRAGADPLRRSLKKYLSTICGLGIVSSAVLYAFADPLLPFFFGEAFRPSIPAMRIMAVCIVFTFPVFLLGSFVVASGGEKIHNRFLVAVLAVNVGLNLALIPEFRHLGPAWANLVSEGIFCLLLAWQARAILKSAKAA